MNAKSQTNQTTDTNVLCPCPKVLFKLLNNTSRMPMYAHVGDSGMDVYANENEIIYPKCFARVKLGIAAVIPDGFELQLRPRSGLASKGIFGSFGTIDNGYRGEISAILINLSHDVYQVHIGDKIGQLVLARVLRANIGFTDDVGVTERGDRGFGSTGDR